MWANLLSAIGKGAVSGVKAAGRGIKSGVTALGERLDEDEGEGMMTTPPFMPGTSPTFLRDYAPWGAKPIQPDPGRIALLSAPTAPPGAMPKAPEMDLSGEGVPIPALPGRGGGPQPYSPAAKAKYEHVMRGAASPAGGFKRSFKDIALNALIGGLQGAATGGGWGGAAGGALAAGAGTAVNPMMGREYQFESIHRPHLEREEERARTDRMRRYEEALRKRDVERIPREAEMDAARLEQIRTQNQVALDNARRQQALTESQIKLNEARTEAARTGKPVISDVVDQDGQIRTYQIFPTGQMVEVGASAKAALQQKQTASREKIAKESRESAERRVAAQQSGATGRTAMTQAGAKERTQMRIDAQGSGQSSLRKPKSMTTTSAQVRAFAQKKGITEAEARKRVAAEGYTVKD